MRTIFFLIALLISFQSFSQDLIIPNNPYDNVDEYNKKKNAFNRERWFYEQRMYPNNFIPEGAYERALQQRDEMRKSQGFINDNFAAWVNIGPTPGYYFSYGNISSRIVTIKYDPVNPNTIYLGAAFGGIWKSTNSGLNWSPKSDYEVSLSSGALAIDPANTNIIYYGTGEATYSGASYYGRGLLKSTNGGNNWVSITAGLPTSTYFSRIAIKPGNSSILIAAIGTGGLYKSTNAGLNWTQIVAGRCDDVLFSPTGDTVYAAGSGTGYRISTDGGNVFNVVAAGVTMSTRNHIAQCKSAPNVMYLAVHYGSGVDVYKSTNAGFTYTLSGASIPGGGQAWYDMYMHVNKFDPNYAYVGLINLYGTTNGGASWINMSGSSVHVDQHNMDFHPTDPNKLFCVNDGGVWSSNDKGLSWTNLNASLTLTQFYRMTSDPNNPSHLMGGTQDNGTQRTTGTMNWNAAFGGDGGEVTFHSQNSNYILGESQNNGLMRSSNNGASWQNATNGLSGSGSWVAPILSHPTLTGVFFTARQQVFRTNDWGASWSAISTGTSGVIREMAISKSNPSIMYATSGSQIYKSIDGGNTFTNVTSGLPGRTITCVNIHPDSSSVAVVTFSGFGAGKIYKTTNTGTSWFSVSGNLPDSPTNDAMIYYPGFSTSIYLVGMDVGVFISSNYGTNWTELADGLPNTVAMHLDYNMNGNKLRIGTHGRGVYETSILVSIVNYNNEMPEGFSLSQNYPNPFNPQTKIKFSLPSAGFTTLRVYNVMGKETITLVNKELNAGTYEVILDGKNLSSGMYFYTFSSGFYKETRKMILVK
ncbi:MAG: T9SS C-terminal target domain-containing protein [Ignavibacteriae bacterium]|nr:MAG: T9SS C-terminal target domain-containing protein [Ignavibacteriota bacterium]